jgi:hypothetical protein
MLMTNVHQRHAEAEDFFLSEPPGSLKNTDGEGPMLESGQPW